MDGNVQRKNIGIFDLFNGCVFLCLVTFPSWAEQENPKRILTSQPKANVFQIRRDWVSTEGNVSITRDGSQYVFRLPASASFEKDNVFYSDGHAVKVEYLSKGAPQAAFKLGNRKGFFEDNPLSLDEKGLLSYAGLAIFPVSDGSPVDEMLELWIGDLDVFMALHQNDPKVVRFIESFVLTYANNPPGGYLMGDQLWDTPRKVQNWNQFYELPLHYDLNGRALTIDGKAWAKIPSLISKDEMERSEKLYRKVLLNLQYNFEGLRTLIKEGGGSLKTDSGLAEVSVARRTYLTLVLLQTGEKIWQKLYLRGH